jgi:hypothetical protein
VKSAGQTNMQIKAKCLLQIFVRCSSCESSLHVIRGQTGDRYSIVLQGVCRPKLKIIPSMIRNAWSWRANQAEKPSPEKKIPVAALVMNVVSAMTNGAQYLDCLRRKGFYQLFTTSH